MEKYETFLQKCKAEDPGDPWLRTEIIPFVVEAHGAAGPEACRLMAVTKHQFGQLVLPCEDKSSEQTFFSVSLAGRASVFFLLSAPFVVAVVTNIYAKTQEVTCNLVVQNELRLKTSSLSTTYSSYLSPLGEG